MWSFFFVWLSIGFERRFLKTELKDLRHKYSIFHLIHLSKSKFFFSLCCHYRSISLVSFFYLRRMLLNLITLDMYILRFDISHSSEFSGGNLNEFFAWTHIGFPF